MSDMADILGSYPGNVSSWRLFGTSCKSVAMLAC